MTTITRKQRPQPKDLKIHQRLATTARAVAQGFKRTIQRKHDSQKGRRALVTEAQLKRSDIVRGEEEEATDRRTYPGLSG